MSLQRKQHLATITLPAAGAYLSASATVGGNSAYTLAEIPDNCPWLLFELEYTPASATGRPKVYVEYSTSGGTALQSIIADGTLSVSGATASREAYLEEVLLQVPPTGSGVPYTYGIPYRVDRGAVVARLAVAEAGDTANPGSTQAHVSGGYGS